jgi:hypothetical protein
MAGDDQDEATEFVRFAQVNGWAARPARVTHRDYADKGRMVEGWSVVARRDDEVVTVTWFDGAAIGPVGWHSSEAASKPIKNQSSARRIIKPAA